LRVPADARFVTCNHCSAHLAVKHNDSVTFTEQLSEINERTERIEEDLAELRSRQEVEDIDREWEHEREQYMVTNKHGHRSVPTSAGSAIGGVVVVVFGIFWTSMASQVGAPGIFPLFGILFIVIGIATSVISFTKAQGYMTAERRYRRRRRDATGRL
jgi:F0F1-type ATP synthase assembly protein I